jgi:hypothetical protein
MAWGGFCPVLEVGKISGSDFKIRATNFKKQGTYFLFAAGGV